MFCIKCGSDAEAGNFCREHFLEKNDLFSLEDIQAYYCDECGKYEKGEVKDQIKGAIETDNRLSKVSIKTRAVGNRIYALVTCSGIITLAGNVTQSKKMLVTLKKRKCGDCVKISGGYYEACLQVRGDRAERIMAKAGKALRGRSVAGVEETTNGYDVKIIDKKDAIRAVKLLREWYEIKDSYKLVGEKKGKKLYRNFYAIR